MKDLVSVIVPIYNVEKDLANCIESILGQSYSNLEIILVNDGSPDNSADICEKYKKIDNRIIVIHKANEGVSVARNIGMVHSTGDWIMFVDGDDYLDKNTVMKLKENADSESDIICCCCTAVIDKIYKKNSFFREPKVEFNTLEDKKRIFLQLTSVGYTGDNDIITAIGVPWGKLYRKSFLEEHNLLFNRKLIRMQDNIFNMYAMYYSRKVVYIDEPLYYYNVEHLGSISNKFNSGIETLYKDVVSERKKCFELFQLTDDEDINNAFSLDAASAIMHIVRRDLFHEENSLPLIKRIHHLRELLKEELFDNIFKQANIKNIPKFKFKLIVFCFKYKLVYLFSSVYFSANKLGLLKKKY